MFLPIICLYLRKIGIEREMTDEEKRIMKTFEARVRQLLLQYSELQKENADLYTELEEKEAEIDILRKDVSQSKNDYANLKLAKMIEISDSDMKEAKLKISRLVREVDKCIEELLSHFPQITYKVAVLCMVNAEPESYGYLDQLEPIGQLLEECAGSVRQAAAAGSGAELSPAQLLDLCLAGKADGMLLADQARQICPDDELLQMLVFGRLDQLPGYFQAHPDHPANTPDLAQRIARLPADLTCCAAARRLWEIVGNRDRLAEIYYTMGLICDGARAAKGLLEIYRQQQDTGRQGQRAAENRMHGCSLPFARPARAAELGERRTVPGSLLYHSPACFEKRRET